LQTFTDPARRTTAFAVAVTLSLGALAACGDDSNDSSGATTTTAAGTPEDHEAPMDEVLAGLATIKEGGTAAATAAADGDFDAALAAFDDLHDVWEEVEGTVKATNVDAYEAIETAQGLIKDGAETENVERVSQGADDQAAAIVAFIAANS
jgi:hypothetical protein